MPDHRRAQEERLHRLLEGTESEIFGPTVTPGTGPDLEQARRRGREIVRRGLAAQRRRILAGRLRHAWDRLRAMGLVRGLSYALNVVALTWIIQGFQPWRYLSPFIGRVEVDGGYVRIYDDRFEDRLVFDRRFDGIVRAANIAPWDGAQRYLVVALESETPQSGALEVVDFRHASDSWAREVAREELVPYYGEDRALASALKCWDFDFADVNGDGQEEIVAVFRSFVYLPSCVRTFDRHGATLGTYWNWGYLEDVYAFDMDKDGRDEVLACGTNNAWSGATVILLDGTHLSGGSSDERVWTDGRLEDGSVSRLIIPPLPPSVMRAAGDMLRLHARSVRVDPQSAGDRISVVIGLPAVHETYGCVTVFMDPLLRPIRVVPHDTFVRSADRWHAEGIVDHDAASPKALSDWMSGYRSYGEASRSGKGA